MSAPRYFKYYAFISYSRKDEAFAKRLQNFLTGFKLPTRLCKQYPDKPKDLRPIYRDKTDLGVDDLNQGLTSGLSLSRHLIVICSENATKPGRGGKYWVDAEVEAFLAMDEENKDYVIPVLLRKKDGPSSRECTPPSVLALNLLAADVSDKGEERVFNDVAAKMLGLEPDELWNWWERVQRFRRRCWGAAGMAAAALASYGGWAVWDYEAKHYTYFADYAEFNNIPQGIHQLTEEETKQRESHYRFVMYHHRLYLVENLNAKGQPVLTANIPGHEERPVAIKLDYSGESGHATQQIYYNAAGEPVQIRQVGPETISFLKPSASASAKAKPGVGHASFTLAPGVEICPENGNVGQLRVERDASGAIIRERYLNIYDSVLRNDNGAGVYGRSFEREEVYGRPISIIYEDAEQQPMPDRRGVVSIRYEYFPDGGPVRRVSYHGADQAPVCGPGGYAVAEYEYDGQGNQISRTLYDQAGKKIGGE